MISAIVRPWSVMCSTKAPCAKGECNTTEMLSFLPFGLEVDHGQKLGYYHGT